MYSPWRFLFVGLGLAAITLIPLAAIYYAVRTTLDNSSGDPPWLVLAMLLVVLFIFFRITASIYRRAWKKVREIWKG